MNSTNYHDYLNSIKGNMTKTIHPISNINCNKVNCNKVSLN